jgi:hypothetical protein
MPPFVRSVVSAMPAWPEALRAPFIVRASARKRLQSRRFSTGFLMEGSNLRLSSNGIIQGRPIESASGANFFHWKGGMTLASPSAPPFRLPCRCSPRAWRLSKQRVRARSLLNYCTRNRRRSPGTPLSAQSRIGLTRARRALAGAGSFLVTHAVHRQRLRIVQRRV